jgi:hypothetical protein
MNLPVETGRRAAPAGIPGIEAFSTQLPSQPNPEIKYYTPPPGSLAVFPTWLTGQGAAIVKRWDGSYVDTTGTDTEGINEAIAEARTGNGGLKIQLFEGTYTVSDSIQLADGVTLEGVGPGTVITHDTALGTAPNLLEGIIWVVDNDNVTIKNLKVVADDTLVAAPIRVDSGSTATNSGITIKDVWVEQALSTNKGDGIVFSCPNSQALEDIKVIDCRITDTDVSTATVSAGIRFDSQDQDCTDIVIEGCKISGFAYGIHFDRTSGTASRVKIDNTTSLNADVFGGNFEYVQTLQLAHWHGTLTFDTCYVDAPYFPVTWFGALGDDSTNNTTAFQNGVNASVEANIPLYIPPGRYRITGQVQEYTGSMVPAAETDIRLIITGANHYDSRILDYNNSAPIFQFEANQNGTYALEVQISDIRIERPTGAGDKKTAFCTKFEIASSTSEFTNVKWFGASNNIRGLAQFDDSHGPITFRNCEFRNNRGMGCMFGTTSQNSGNVSFYGCTWSAVSVGIYITGSHTNNNFNFDGCKWVLGPSPSGAPDAFKMTDASHSTEIATLTASATSITLPSGFTSLAADDVIIFGGYTAEPNLIETYDDSDGATTLQAGLLNG